MKRHRTWSLLLLVALALVLSGCGALRSLDWYPDGKTPSGCERALAEQQHACKAPDSATCVEATAATKVKCTNPKAGGDE